MAQSEGARAFQKSQRWTQRRARMVWEQDFGTSVKRLIYSERRGISRLNLHDSHRKLSRLTLGKLPPSLFTNPEIVSHRESAVDPVGANVHGVLVGLAVHNPSSVTWPFFTIMRIGLITPSA